jgi:hypothetical protein
MGAPKIMLAMQHHRNQTRAQHLPGEPDVRCELSMGSCLEMPVSFLVLSDSGDEILRVGRNRRNVAGVDPICNDACEAC